MTREKIIDFLARMYSGWKSRKSKAYKEWKEILEKKTLKELCKMYEEA